MAANNYVVSLLDQQRYAEAKSLMRKTMPVARRVLGESHDVTLKVRWLRAVALCNDPSGSVIRGVAFDGHVGTVCAEIQGCLR